MPFRLVINSDEVLALDEYFTKRVGYIGHEDDADHAAHALANVITSLADRIREGKVQDTNADDSD